MPSAVKEIATIVESARMVGQYTEGGGRPSRTTAPW